LGEQGGMINLLLVGKNIRLEINSAAVEQARIVMDPKLISMSFYWSPEPALAPNRSIPHSFSNQGE